MVSDLFCSVHVARRCNYDNASYSSLHTIHSLGKQLLILSLITLKDFSGDDEYGIDAITIWNRYTGSVYRVPQLFCGKYNAD